MASEGGSQARAWAGRLRRRELADDRGNPAHGRNAAETDLLEALSMASSPIPAPRLLLALLQGRKAASHSV